MRVLTLMLMPLAGAGCGDRSTDPSHTFSPTPFVINTPAGFPTPEIPSDNALTLEGIELGQRLFSDPILSVDSTVACATCHLPEQGFSDPRQFSRGVGGMTSRNSMPIFNVLWRSTLFWDGRAPSLEEQALEPIRDPIEMGESWSHIATKLQRHPDYPRLFADAFGPNQPIDSTLVVQAIAQFERSLISADSKYDHWLAGTADFTPVEKQGFLLFHNEQGDCFHCHGAPLFTDNQFHNNGLDLDPQDPGLAAFTQGRLDHGKFITPTLRNIEYTAPYMHDGRFQTLEEVIDHYDSGFHRTRLTDPVLLIRPNLGLNRKEKRALIAFLKTLSDTRFKPH